MGGIWVAGLLAGFGIAVQVGAITVLIITLSAQHSLRTGWAAGMGTATADGLYALLAATAGTGVAALLRPIAGPMRLVAAAVLLLIAAKGLTTVLRARRAERCAAEAESAAPPRESPRRPLGAYLQVLGLTMLNPLTIIYFSTLVLGLHAGHSWTFLDGTVFVLAAFAASACWQSVLAVGGAVLGRALTGPRGRLGSALVGNAVIALLAAHLLVR